ncbi:hypothetical protein Cgig2_013974 [Carnegiea gigantea]|uniref:Structural constituent of ribosome n=1 Tax=Carnegiea gigantea TaxID=171969 RepID=A0A9Q1KZ65_9CARY|nr:hypothetical protein Cgig2_013974 [Carnegiea gigantea]
MAILAVGSSISPTPYFSASQSTRIKGPTRSTKHFGLFRSRIVSLSSPLPDSQRPPTTSQGHGENLSPPHSFPAKSIGDTPSSQGPKFGTYAVANPNGNPAARLSQSTESSIERRIRSDPGSSRRSLSPVIYDFRFLALLAIGGSLAGSLLCFLNGCVYIVEAYKTYWNYCLKGIHGGQMVLRLVEAIDVYLAGTVMLIFAMGLYGLFISNIPPNEHPTVDRALKDSSLFGMFALKERPRWMKISSLDELKTKVGHVIVMILLVKMFERSKMVTIATGLDLLSYSVCIFLSSASLYVLHNLHKSESD